MWKVSSGPTEHCVHGWGAWDPQLLGCATRETKQPKWDQKTFGPHGRVVLVWPGAVPGHVAQILDPRGVLRELFHWLPQNWDRKPGSAMQGSSLGCASPSPAMSRGQRCILSLKSSLRHVGGRTQVLCFVTRGILPTSAVGFCLNRDYFSKNCRDILSLFIESDEEVQGMQKLTLPFQFPLLLDHLKLHFKISVFYLMRFLNFHTKDSHKTHLQR